MLSRLDPLIKIVARHAENINSKMDLRRDESTINERNKDGNEEKDSKTIPWEDTTEVSVEALRHFLQELLSGPQSIKSQQIIHSPESAITPSTSLSNSNAAQSYATKAAKAYQATGKMVHDTNIVVEKKDFSHDPDRPQSVVLSDDFKDEERLQMQGYVNDLISLERSGITILFLQRNLTFLESIRQAVEAAKT